MNTAENPKAATVETPAAEPEKTPYKKGFPRGRLTTGKTVCTMARRLTEAQLAGLRARKAASWDKLTERECWKTLADIAIDKLCNELEREGSKLLATEREKTLSQEEAELQARLQALREERQKILRGAA